MPQISLFDNLLSATASTDTAETKSDTGKKKSQNKKLLPQMEFADTKSVRLKFTRICKLDKLKHNHIYDAEIKKERYTYLIKFYYDNTDKEDVDVMYNFGSMVSINNTFEWVTDYEV